MGYLTRLSAGAMDQPIHTAQQPPAKAAHDTPPVGLVKEPAAEAEPAAVAEAPRPETAPAPKAGATQESKEVPQVGGAPVAPIQLDGPAAPDDTAARKAHEAAEAKRRAEFDARQAAKRAARQEQLDRIKAMNDADLLAASLNRVSADTEKLTRRNMTEAIAEQIQAKCREDAAFALLVMDPDKSMINCFQYITRKAREYAEQEMKDNGIERTGVYGLDVPDGLCYQWAEGYFNDPDAKEDHKDDEQFVPKPYVPKSGTKSAKKAKKEPKPKPAPKPRENPGVDGQISLMGEAV